MASVSAPIGPNEVIITDNNYQNFLSGTDGAMGRKCGLKPITARKKVMQYSLVEAGVAGSFDIPLIPENEWEDRLAQQIKDKAQLSDIRNAGMFGKRMPSRDQGSQPYCWAHSSTSAALICRALDNQPYADLSAYAVACVIKNYRSQGGWSEESLKFIQERGIPTSKTWPQQSKNKGNDNPETWKEASSYRFTPEWMFLDNNQMKAQLVTCLLLGLPVTTDLNWWSHAIITLDLVSLNPFRTRIWNSWGDNWSEGGTGILEGRKAIPDDAQCPRTMKVAA